MKLSDDYNEGNTWLSGSRMVELGYNRKSGCERLWDFSVRDLGRKNFDKSQKGENYHLAAVFQKRWEQPTGGPTGH